MTPLEALGVFVTQVHWASGPRLEACSRTTSMPESGQESVSAAGVFRTCSDTGALAWMVPPWLELTFATVAVTLQ